MPTSRAKPLLLAAVVFVSALNAVTTTASTTTASSDTPYAVATAHPEATQAALDVLQHGGNAFDAAIAATAALGVVEPYAAGLGGGGFYLLQQQDSGRRIVIDARERAPLAAHRDLYLDPTGEVIPGRSIDGPLAAGIPGIPAALAHLAKQYGRLPLSRSLAPAISLARNGFIVTPHYRRYAAFRENALNNSPEASQTFLLFGKAPPVGHLLRQPALANTLQQLAQYGRAGFYRGPIAQRLIQGVRQAGGIWTQADLDQYRIIERKPISIPFGDLTITSVPPPSSGGIALAQILGQLEQLGINSQTPAGRVHTIIEAMRRAYRDRAQYLGDSDYVDVPIEWLTSKKHSQQMASNIHPQQATPSRELAAYDAGTGGQHTTHFSIVDQDGNRVSATLSINYPFGSGFVAPGTGVLLNDEMDDFSAKPGSMNVYGLVGSSANAIAPGKRMLSSMSPSFIDGPDGFAVLGTPGGSRIITMVLLGILKYQETQDAQAMVETPRFHHQFLPDQVQLEPHALATNVLNELQQYGHQLKTLNEPYGNMQAIVYHTGKQTLDAASDPRGEGAAAVCSARDCRFRQAQTSD